MRTKAGIFGGEICVAAAAVIIGESNSAPERLGQLNWSEGKRKEREIK
jgi:hypothetical protein